jgi:hypothetical protein
MKNQVFGRSEFFRSRGFKPEGLQFCLLLPYNGDMKLSRSQIREGLEQIPMQTILGVSSKALTSKQKAFCKEVAMGQTGSEAFRRSYKSKGNPKTVANKASQLKKRGDIQATITAMELAIQAAEYQTPAGLRALVIQTLVQTMIDPEAKDSVKVAAAKTLGTVTEVAAFTERRETKVITSSEDAKSKLLAKLRDMMKANATDATVIDADSLLMELAAPVDEVADVDTHPVGTPQAVEPGTLHTLHTIPHKPSQDFPDPPLSNFEDDDPTPQSEEDPPIEDSK